MSETRLETLKRYQAEARLDPKANKLYLEDLALSIVMEELKPEYQFTPLVVMHGFVIKE